ncbi:hypothetical protein AB1K91_18400 [Terribacillus sp. 179-K 1B1 HS]|uniref:hypothetical protein n=1 Tax=Terribacillus sp. 179-K 1B1 HS TaxID=3142388 RepID=UPI0039A228CF
MKNRRVYQHNGNGHKAALHREQKIPPKEARERADNWLWDQETLRVFVDTSELKRQGIFGLGAIYVGQGCTYVKSKKQYNSRMQTVSIYGEVMAVDFAIQHLDFVLGNLINAPSKVIINSDWKGIDLVYDEDMLLENFPIINDVAKRINKKMELFSLSNPDIDLIVSSLNSDEKRYNPFYRAAHNASRKAIGLSRMR